jgi:hypothetical protein
MENTWEVNIILAVTALGKRPFREQRTLEENIIIDLREMGCGDGS